MAHCEESTIRVVADSSVWVHHRSCPLGNCTRYKLELHPIQAIVQGQTLDDGYRSLW